MCSTNRALVVSSDHTRFFEADAGVCIRSQNAGRNLRSGVLGPEHVLLQTESENRELRLSYSRPERTSLDER